MTRLLAGLILCWIAASPAAAQPAKDDGVAALLHKVELAIQSGDPSRYLALLSPSADPERARIFVGQAAAGGVTRAVVRERDRAQLFGTLPGDGYRLLVEAFLERGVVASLATWRLDVRRLHPPPGAEAAGDEWAISDEELITTLPGLRHLILNARREFTARNLTVTGEDFQLTLTDGQVFTEETDGNPTALVLLGRGDMAFRPTPEVERSQVRIFAGADVVQSPFDAAFVRTSAFDLADAVASGVLTERAPDPRDVKRADDIFKTDAVKSFVLDVGDLSSDIWSLAPSAGDLLAEIHTRRFDTLTYTQSHNEAEDISLFDRKRRRNISIYASQAKRQTLGPSYDESATADYSPINYEVQASFLPDRSWIDGRTRMTIRVRTVSASSLSFRLADSLAVRAVIAEGFGRVLAIRVRGRNTVVVNLPSPVSKGVELTLMVYYSGRLEPLPTDREVASAGRGQDPSDNEAPTPPEESFLYSNRSYWYPQSVFDDFATATLRLTVPPGFTCVASGLLQSSAPAAGAGAEQPQARLFTFVAEQPVRYLSCLISRLVMVKTHNLRISETLFGRPPARAPGAFRDTIELTTMSQPRQLSRARRLADRAVDVLRFYASIVGDFPYPSLTVAVIEAELPGGHSPGYMAVLNQPTTGAQKTWRDDPATFDDFSDYFLAHELAHQWWGQAVGWKNYHEQWLSEGFAQYFAALYAEHARGRSLFDSMMRRMQHFGQEDSDQGPIYLGYRVGHLKGDRRLFRAVVYDKSAVVLQMLRRLIGDDAFFRGLRRFYAGWRFKKAGTADLQQAFEAEAGIPLQRFFDRWIYGQTIPQVRVTTQTIGVGAEQEAVVRFEQVGEVFDVPVTVTLDYANRSPADVLVKLTDQVTETRIPLRGALRKIDVNRDALTIGDFIRQLP